MKTGSLFSGYGGLDMGVQAVLGGETAWFVEFDGAPSKVLAHHWPDVPNHGDITAVDWANVEPVDILTGGFPCQDVSLAGLRRGLRAGTRSGLWSEFAKAIDVLRPALVVIENVRGLLSAEASGALEPDPWNLGNGPDEPALRALGAVLGDLADLGYDAEWCGLRAADAGAPHGRFRVFVVAHPAGQQGRVRDGDDLRTGRRAVGRASDSGSGLAEDADVATRSERRIAAPGQAPGGRPRSDAGGRGGAPAANTGRDESERWRGPCDVAGATRAGEGEGDQRQRLRNAALDRSTTPSNAPGYHRGRGTGTRASGWGPYAPAVERWERITGRLAPAPTRPDGRDGGERLSPIFVEWMMGLPEGHVTDVGITRSDQLKALGNGVVPQQAALAVSTLLGHTPLNERQEQQ